MQIRKKTIVCRRLNFSETSHLRYVNLFLYLWLWVNHFLWHPAGLKSKKLAIKFDWTTEGQSSISSEDYLEYSNTPHYSRASTPYWKICRGWTLSSNRPSRAWRDRSENIILAFRETSQLAKIIRFTQNTQICKTRLSDLEKPPKGSFFLWPCAACNSVTQYRWVKLHCICANWPGTQSWMVS